MAAHPHSRTLTLEVRIAWWLRIYFIGIATAAALTGSEPDWTKVKRWVNRGVQARIAGTKGRWQ